MSLLRFLLILPVTLALAFPMPAQTVDPKLAAMLQHTLDSMRTVLQVKGLSAAVQLPNDAVWAGARGISSLVPTDSLRTEHAFAVGSTAKMLTAACVLQLADEAVLSLDDSLHQWLPSFQYINPNITIRQLLQHRSGLYDVVANPVFQPTLLQNKNKVWTLQEAISTFINPPVFSPGTSWGYSNTNYILLGMIIEATTGKPYHEEIRSRFLNPFQLDGFAMPPFEPLPAQVAHLWTDLNGDGVQDDAHNFFSTWNSFFSAAAPAGSYFARPSDMARWVRRFGSGSLCLPGTWAQATTTVNTGMPGGTKYGLGLMERNYLGIKGYGHGGDISYSSSVFYFPEKDISIAVHSNDGKINSWSLATTVAALLRVYLDCESMLTNSDQATVTLPEEMLVAPNPFDEFITVTVPYTGNLGILKSTLTNAAGQPVASWTLNDTADGSFRLSVPEAGSLPPGVYFLSVTVNGTSAGVKKLIRTKP